MKFRKKIDAVIAVIALIAIKLLQCCIQLKCQMWHDLSSHLHYFVLINVLTLYQFAFHVNADGPGDHLFSMHESKERGGVRNAYICIQGGRFSLRCVF